MSRAFLVTVHMYLSAFFAPFILMVAISGGLYLAGIKGDRSEEHTSELQSHHDIVCRLLLEEKNINKQLCQHLYNIEQSVP